MIIIMHNLVIPSLHIRVLHSLHDKGNTKLKTTTLYSEEHPSHLIWPITKFYHAYRQKKIPKIKSNLMSLKN